MISTGLKKNSKLTTQNIKQKNHNEQQEALGPHRSPKKQLQPINTFANNMIIPFC